MIECIHRGPCIAYLPCQSCKGSVYVKVFACKYNEACSIEKGVVPLNPGKYMVCSVCPSRTVNEFVQTIQV